MKFREKVFQLLFFHIGCIKRAEPRRIAQIRLMVDRDHLGMARRVFSFFQLFADLSGLHLDFFLHPVCDRRFSDAGRTGYHRCFPFQVCFHFLHALLFRCTHRKDTVTAVLIDASQMVCVIFPRKISFIETDCRRNVLLFHHHKKTVQKRQVRGRIFQRKNHKRLIDIGHCRTDQFIFSRQNPGHISCFFHFIQNLDFHKISDERFLAFLSENSFCFALINAGFFHVYVVESGNSFHNLSCHTQPSLNGTDGYCAIA